MEGGLALFLLLILVVMAGGIALAMYLTGGALLAKTTLDQKSPRTMTRPHAPHDHALDRTRGSGAGNEGYRPRRRFLRGPDWPSIAPFADRPARPVPAGLQCRASCSRPADAVESIKSKRMTSSVPPDSGLRTSIDVALSAITGRPTPSPGLSTRGVKPTP
jgi:hypothetical protein